MVKANGKSAMKHLVKMAHGELDFAKALKKFRDAQGTAQGTAALTSPHNNGSDSNPSANSQSSAVSPQTE